METTVMSVTSSTQNTNRYFWPGLSVTFFCIYVICNTYNIASSPRSRQMKQQPNDITDDVLTAAPQRAEVQGHLPNSSGHTEEWRDNIVYPKVDISNFEPVDQAECHYMMQDIEIAPANSMPLIALASFPRSGNTWSRSLIQIATRLYTGSVHWETERNLQRVKDWFKAGQEDFALRKGVCVKTHNFGKEHIDMFEDGAILLLRNPYYSLLSEFMRINNVMMNETNERIVDMLKTKDERWTKEFLPQYEKWKFTALSWIIHCKRLLIVFYENLESNPVYELTRMVSFLRQPINPKRIQCAVHSFPPITGRTNHTSQLNFNPYTPEQHTMIENYITDINQTLIRKQATPLPTYKKYLHPT